MDEQRSIVGHVYTPVMYKLYNAWCSLHKLSYSLLSQCGIYTGSISVFIHPYWYLFYCRTVLHICPHPLLSHTRSKETCTHSLPFSCSPALGKKCQTVPLKLQTNKQTNKQTKRSHSCYEPVACITFTWNETCYLCISVLFKFSLQKDSINNIYTLTWPFSQ